jgi:acyl dehydratase/NAD(P)-dependent dehydrogenase (short-subunit alcohol dehydrogenase family)
MTDEPLASRVFTMEDQLAFARLSRDRNPMHLDANFARRTQAGAPVVHGIHDLLWAMDAVLRSSSFNVQGIKVRFQQPLFLDEIARIEIRSRTETAINLEVIAAGTVIATIRLSSKPATAPALARPIAVAPQPIAEPTDIPFEQMADQKGTVAADAGGDELRTLFPALSNSIGIPAVQALLATSQIIGMACPGLHSLFAGLDVSRDPASASERALCYAVSKTDARFRSLQIEVSGSGISGRLDAFARLPPTAQPDMAAVSARVTKGAFAGQRVLIIGGSRGLGEVTARIVAAGGGHPVITYFEGQREAEAVAAGIRDAGGGCDVVRYDAREAASRQLKGVGAVDSCYYFATPKIFQRKSDLFEPERLRSFLSYYADGFHDLCTALAQDRGGRIGVFYPSTVAIEEEVAGAAEYAMAKVAGEILAKYINAFLPAVHVISRRLPRTMTDQTATIGVASAQDALDVMLPIVYEVQQIARP